MRNNKGFAITATIYGFLVLFLIILLSVLSVTRSQNNRSVIMGDKISNDTFINIDDSDEITVDNQIANDFSMVTNRGKYYLRIMKNNIIIEDCYFYFPDKGTMILKDGSLKINNINAYIYNIDGTVLENSGITEAIITKYYVENKITANFDLNYFNQDMNTWYFVHKEQFYSKSPNRIVYDNNNDMNSLIVEGGLGKWEQILFPIPVEKDVIYTINFDYSIPNNYSALSGYSGIGYQVLNKEPSNSGNDNIGEDILVAYGFLPTEATSNIETVSLKFTAKSTGIYYFNFNFGMTEDNKDTNINLGNFKIFSNKIKKKTVSYNSEIGALDNSLTRTGYNFTGWYDKRKDGNRVESNSIMPYNNTTYYAGWSANSMPINVIFDNSYLKGDFSGETFNKNNYAVYPTEYLESSSSSYLANAKGNKFLKFRMKKISATECGGSYYFRTSFIGRDKLNNGTSYTWSVYIKTDNERYMSIGPEQGGVRHNILTNSNWQRVQGTFIANNDNVYNNVIFYSCDWAQDEGLYIHSFELAETKDVSGNEITQGKVIGNKFGALPTPTRSGYTFDGWYSDPLSGYQISENSIIYSLKDRYYAHWVYN